MERVSKNKISYIKSLHQAKFRQKYRKFIVEGFKSLLVFLKNPKYKCELLVCLGESMPSELSSFKFLTLIADDRDMKEMSALVTPTNVIGVFDQVENSFDDMQSLEGSIFLLDGIQDPGNCGTIVRIADWFGVKGLLTTEGCADFYSPKVVQATMGSLTNVFFKEIKSQDLLKFNRPLIALDMGGNVIDQNLLPQNAIYVFGSEGRGISPEIKSLCTSTIIVPGSDYRRAESLNVAVTAGIVASHLRIN
jgi:RNA methyltransferase, TrmH family